jgi:hypothetical protein
MAPTPDSTTRWYQALLPIAQAGGPLLTLALMLALVASLWWLTGWMRECVEHNRAMTERLIAQQQTFTQELRLALAHCQPER